MKSASIKQYDYIDALRGFAILGVIVLHTYYWVPPSSFILAKIAHHGGIGVQLFFIVSALTLFLSIYSRRNIESKSWGAFYIRRFFRIAPLFYLAIIVYFGGPNGQYWAPNGIEWWHVLSTLMFMHGWHPETINSVVPGGWTIAIEMTFYLCIPYLFFKLKDIKSTLWALFILLILSNLLARLAEYFVSPLYSESQQYLVDFFYTSWFFSQLPIFIMGVLLYHLIIRYPNRDAKTGLFFMLLSVYLFAAFLSVETFANLLPKHILYGLALTIFSLSLHFMPARLFVNKATIFIGKISFSLYLVHFMILDIAKKQFVGVLKDDLGFFIAFFLVLIVSICISSVTHKLIEIPGIALGKKIIRKMVIIH